MAHKNGTNDANHPNRSGTRASYYAGILGLGTSGVPDVGPPNTADAAIKASGLHECSECGSTD